MVGLEHLRDVMLPAFCWEVDEVQSVLLLPGGGPQLPVRLADNNQPGPVGDTEGDVSEPHAEA